MQIDKVETRAGVAICAAPSRIACSISFPDSRLRLMFSISTVASSTRMPTASAKPPSVMMLIVSFKAASAANEHRIERGIETAMISVERPMIRAMARQAEAERGRRAKVIHAEGEKQAAQTLAEAAKILSNEPASLQLRYLQTLADISNEKSSTIVFPLPLDLITPLLRPTRPE